MIPLRDDVPSQTTPVFNYVLIAANVVAFLYELSLGRQLSPFIEHFGVVPAAYVDLGPISLRAHVVPLFTSMFLHGGLLHIGGNLLYLYIFGDNVEDRLGHLRYLAFYLLSGVVASAAHIVVNPESTVPSIGASGAIGGVLGAYLVLYPRARVVAVIPIFIFFQFVTLPAFFFLGFWIVMQLLLGAASLGATTAQSGGVAFFAHIGGFAFGAVLGRILARPERRPSARDVWWLDSRRGIR